MGQEHHTGQAGEDDNEAEFDPIPTFRESFPFRHSTATAEATA
jgi:hypothetical protein